MDPRLFGELYAAPYGVLEPEHALVLDDGAGTAIGYVLGALDTRAFEARCEAEWWPALRARHPIGSGGNDLDELLIAMLHRDRTSPTTPWSPSYPSHLHIDLLPEAQGAGMGAPPDDARWRTSSAPTARRACTSAPACATSARSRSTGTSATRSSTPMRSATPSADASPTEERASDSPVPS